MLRGGTEGTEMGGKLETGKFHQNIFFATIRANERALKTKELFSMIKEKVEK